jgi:hypothetical protein
MERFVERKCLAGILQPGDATRYCISIVEDWDCYHAVILNEDFFDKLIFLKTDLSYYSSMRDEKTNPWTIKAAEEMLRRFLGIWEDK